jgi:hypothetical protein
MQSNQDVLSWRGREVVDRDGDKLGSIEEIYLDAETDEPTWAAVKTGMFGSRSTFVPVSGAQLDGDRVRVAHEKAHIKDAPNIESDGELSPAEEDRLYEHYDVATGTSVAGTTAGGPSGDDDVATDTSEDDVTSGQETGARRSGEAGAPVTDTVGGGSDTVSDRDRDAATLASVDTDRDTATDSTAAGEAGTVQSGDRPADAAPTGGTGGAVTGGMQEDATTASEGRRPRIRRFVTEEVDESGRVTKRETRTEETFS